MAYEWRVRDLYRRLGYVYAQTSRGCDRSLDNAGVDLANTGEWYVQIKAVESGVNAHRVLDNMPNEQGKIRVVVHKKNKTKAHGGVVVSMYWADYEKIVQDRNKAIAAGYITDV